MGLYRPDEGKLFVGGHRVRFHSPRDALCCSFRSRKLLSPLAWQRSGGLSG
jgi:hypothetical protein